MYQTILNNALALVFHNNWNADDNTYAPELTVVSTREPTGEIVLGYCSHFHVCELAKLLRQQEKVQAIKHLRDITGLGLKHAKDVCDWLETNCKAELEVTVKNVQFYS